MPTIISHPAIPLATAMVGGHRLISIRLLMAAAVASILPDADAVGFYFGIPYEHTVGHRGFSHSIAFALIIGLLGVLLTSRLHARRITAFLVLFISVLSHGLLDAMTSGGLGIAFFSPFSNERYFLPWQVISVSPLSVERFISGRGLEILKSEFVWIWFPSFAIGCFGMVCRLLLRRFTDK